MRLAEPAAYSYIRAEAMMPLKETLMDAGTLAITVAGSAFLLTAILAALQVSRQRREPARVPVRVRSRNGRTGR